MLESKPKPKLESLNFLKLGKVMVRPKNVEENKNEEVRN